MITNSNFKDSSTNSPVKDPALTTIKNLLILAGAFIVMIIVAGGLAMWLGGFFEPNSRSCYLAQATAQNIVEFCGAAVATALLITRRPWKFLGLTESFPRQSFIGVIIVMTLGIPFLNQLIYYNSQMHLPDSMAGLEQYMRQMEDINAKVTEVILSATSVRGLLSGILIIGLLTGFSEEILFRGTLQRIMTRNGFLHHTAIWTTAILFSAAHVQFFGFFPRLLLGAFFGYLIYSTGSIWPGVFAHALNNSLVVFTQWLTHRGSSLAISDKWGVATTGFPLWGTISLVALTIFLLFGWKYFFCGKRVISQNY